jgi:tetratricopeptide (TPR) repeat protein
MGDDSDLFGTLDALVERGDAQQLAAACRRNADAIRTGFVAWKQVPPEVRADPAAVQRYASTLITVAQTFAQALGDPSLMALLAGSAQDNPIVQWQQAIEGARAAIEGRSYDVARAGLEAALERARGLAGPGAERLRAITIGLLGQALFHGGRVREAVARFEEALALCRAQDDDEGRAAYLAALYEAHRWLGMPEVAAGLAQQLAELHDGLAPDAARHWRGRAAAARAGEPRVRVWLDVQGQRLDPDALPPGLTIEGSVQVVLERDRMGLGHVAGLVARGREHGAKRELEAALACFDEAARTDPNDPEPEYLRGQTLLHMKRLPEAVAAYRRTEALAPGWYHCRTDGWLAEELAAARVPAQAFEMLVALEGDGSVDERVALATHAVHAWPELAPLWLAQARALAQAGRPADARRAAEAGLAVAKEPDVETRLLVELAQWIGDDQRESLLLRAITSGGNRVARALAQMMLAMRAGPG